MSLAFPWTFSKDDPAGPELENRLQDVLDTLGQQFPVSGAQIANDVLRLKLTGTSRRISFGSGTSAASFGGTVALTTTIAHGLGATPLWAHVQSSEIVSTVGTGPVVVSFQATPWDATNLNVRARIADGGTSLNFPTWYWAVIG